MIDLIVTYIESVQKHRKLSQDSVDTFNSLIWQSLIKLYDILHCLKLFLYEWLRVKYPWAVGSQFEALGVFRSKSCRKQTLIFLNKKRGSVFFNFFIWALLRPQIAIRICAIISRVIFSWFWPLKIQISQKKLYGQNPLGMLNQIGFQNFKKVEFWLKNYSDWVQGSTPNMRNRIKKFSKPNFIQLKQNF